jgi:REP element-mobilizing transposase RayT
MPQSLVSLHVHIIFSTKERAPLIAPALQPRLYEYIGGILRADKNSLIAAGGISDHVHLLVSLGRESSIADTVRIVKSNCSKWIHESFRDLEAFAWQAGYGAFAVSFSNLGQVKRYIAEQEDHHRKRTFQEEYREFLRRHEIEFDERYVWD